MPRPREPCSVFGTDYGRRCTASTGAPRAPHTTITRTAQLTAITGPRVACRGHGRGRDRQPCIPRRAAESPLARYRAPPAMKRSEIGTFDHHGSTSPRYTGRSRDAVNHGGLERSSVRVFVGAAMLKAMRGRQDGPRRPPASSHGAGPGKSFDERVYFYARPTRLRVLISARLARRTCYSKAIVHQRETAAHLIARPRRTRTTVCAASWRHEAHAAAPVRTGIPLRG